MHRAVVHQAGGMVSVQARVPIADAVVMLRAYAFSEDRSITDVAAEIVGGTLRLNEHPGGPEE